MNFGLYGLLDHWIVGSLDCWIIGLLDHWIVGSLDCWINGSLDEWINEGLHHVGRVSWRIHTIIQQSINPLIQQSNPSGPAAQEDRCNTQSNQRQRGRFGHADSQAREVIERSLLTAHVVNGGGLLP